ncbi:reverse transcriptase [Ancylostoma ceylanicum]|uniref:RNA-directed DNA polymerase n=1 Tax=Ancylostoma ceylanicum TaxID=53326 RepID=A0A0D6LD85_9BILA|nr:reverse transcriptase [Ancylostoma ceylanicum]
MPSSSQAMETEQAPRTWVDPYGDLVRDLPTFNYERDEDETFNAWYTRYGLVIDDRGKTLSDDRKRKPQSSRSWTRQRIRRKTLSDDRKRNLIVEKLDKATYKTYSEYVLPLKPQEIDLAATIDNLRKLFGPKRTLTRRRYEFLLSKCPPLNGAYVLYREYGNMIKRKFEDATMKDVDSDSLKCLLFLSGLTDPSHSEMRLRLLNQLNRLKESDPAPLLDDFINECETFVTLRTDNRAIESKEVNAAYQRKPAKQDKKHPYSLNKDFRYRRQPRDHSLHSPSRNERSASPAKKRGTKRPKRKHRCKNIAASAHVARTYLKVRINGHPTRLQLDTGADTTMISRRTWEDMDSPKLDHSTITIRTADGSAMNILGSFNAAFTISDRKGRPTDGTGCCYVTESTDLLGLEWCIQMHDYKELREQYNCKLASAAIENARDDIVSRLKTRFADVFSQGLGRCTKTKARLFLKPGARPIYRQKRPVPFASQAAVNVEIDRLVSEGVLGPVNHSKWAAPIVVVRKSNGTIRTCADFSAGLNDALMLHRHPLPTVEDVFNKNKKELFSQINLADAYLQIEVDDESKELLAINTHCGLFRYNRLTFGVKSAPGIFHQIIDSMIAGLNGVAAYLDDIIVTGRNMEEHRQNLEALSERIHTYGFRVRIEKCTFMMSEIRYLGDTIYKDGRRPDPEKIRAITEMLPPKDVVQLRLFIGMVNYYGVFITDMRQLRAPLNALLKKNTPFKWSSDCQHAFDKAKKVLASPLLLTHFDLKLELIVAADASDYGIRAVVMHRFADGTEKAICHASRNLTDAEKKYEQIEKEGLALVYAVRKFHRYLLGRHFTLLTDHKPLLAIFGSKKGLPTYGANRLLSWSLILRGYDFTIEYRKTANFGQADALSRLIAEQTTPSEDVVIAQAIQEAEADCPRHGHVTYDVLIEGRVHRRHSNQMRRNAREETEKTLLDLFDLPTLPVQTSPNTTPASTDTQAQDTTLRRLDSSEPKKDSPDMSPATTDAETRTIPTPTPLRRSQRNRRPPIRLDVNPTRKTYRS